MTTLNCVECETKLDSDTICKSEELTNKCWSCINEI